MYEWVKVCHIVSIISWMAAMFYMPRLFINHFDSPVGSQQSEVFKGMERRLMRGIMTPAMIASWVFGIWLMILLEAWQEGWFVTKFFLVILLSAYHGVCVKWMKEFADNERRRSTRFYRVANEMPVVVMIFVVILVVVKPF